MTRSCSHGKPRRSTSVTSDEHDSGFSRECSRSVGRRVVTARVEPPRVGFEPLGSSETSLRECGRIGRLSLALIVQCFELCRRNLPDRPEQSPVVEPVDPLERCGRDLFEVARRSVRVDQFGLVEAVDRLRESVVVRVSDSADRGLDPCLLEPLRITDRKVLRRGRCDGPAPRDLVAHGALAPRHRAPGRCEATLTPASRRSLARTHP